MTDADGARRALLAAFCYAVLSSPARAGAAPRPDDPDLLAEGMYLRGFVESPTQGCFVDLVRAIGEVYRGGHLRVEVTSMARVFRDVVAGTVDFGFPMVRVPQGYLERLGCRASTTGFGRVSFVLYSPRSRSLTPDDLARQAHRKPFPFRVVGPPVLDLPYPVETITNLDSALRRVEAGRIDAVITDQEEGDDSLRRLGLHQVHRALFQTYDDVFLLPLGARGDFVDRILTTALDALRADGRLAALYANIHAPFRDWQPEAPDAPSP